MHQSFKQHKRQIAGASVAIGAAALAALRMAGFANSVLFLWAVLISPVLWIVVALFGFAVLLCPQRKWEAIIDRMPWHWFDRLKPSDIDARLASMQQDIHAMSRAVNRLARAYVLAGMQKTLPKAIDKLDEIAMNADADPKIAWDDFAKWKVKFGTDIAQKLDDENSDFRRALEAVRRGDGLTSSLRRLSAQADKLAELDEGDIRLPENMLPPN